MANNEWRAYVRVDDQGQIVLELDARSYEEFVGNLLPRYRSMLEPNLAEGADWGVVIKPRSDETTLPGVKR